MEQGIKNQQFDAIIVGTGPGGATVARELAKANKKILMLEWGTNEPVKGTIPQAISFTGIPGKNILFTGKMLAMVRATITGGSSVIYYATAFNPPLDMLKSYGIDISDEVAEVKEELPIAPLDDDLVGPFAKRIMQSAQDLGYDWKKLPKFVYQDKCRLDCDKCNLGCPYGAKWNAKMFADEAVENGAFMINGAKVKKVLFSGKETQGVEYSIRGIKQQAYAPIVIISAGGIGSPVILKNSGIPQAGNDFFYDPLIGVMGTVDDLSGGREFPMATGVHMEDEGYLMTDMTIPQALYMAFTAEVFRFDKLFSHSHTLQIMIKAKDDLGGYLSKRGGVHKPLEQKDKSKLLKGYERAKKILTNAGARDIYKSWYIAAHPGGTAKINDIVDSNLQTEYKNLYVCDCSVIPEAWGLPPTLTLIGLGKRLAKHLNNNGST